MSSSRMRSRLLRLSFEHLQKQGLDGAHYAPVGEQAKYQFFQQSISGIFVNLIEDEDEGEQWALK